MLPFRAEIVAAPPKLSITGANKKAPFMALHVAGGRRRQLALAALPQAAKQRGRSELSRALALSRSLALVLARLLLSSDSATKLVLFAQGTPKKKRFYCSHSHI